MEERKWWHGNELAIAVLAVLGLYVSLATGLIFPLIGVAAIVALGAMSNLMLRLIPNLFNWQRIAEGWIWIVVAYLAFTPFLIALVICLAPVALAMCSNQAAFLYLWLFLLPYFVWLIGYIWGWMSPRFDLGTADVVMASAMNTAWAKFRLWWLEQRFRLGSWLLGL